MDEQLTLHELQRLEAQRKLCTIPQQVLETTWVRDAQVEAVIDAVLAVTLGGDAKAYTHARHVGEWCARIASALPNGPEPKLARRVGVLADVDPAALERIDELKHLGLYVRDYQRVALEGAEVLHMMSTIVSVADEFDSRLSGPDGAASPSQLLRMMVSEAQPASRPVLAALRVAVRAPIAVQVA